MFAARVAITRAASRNAASTATCRGFVTLLMQHVPVCMQHMTVCMQQCCQVGACEYKGGGIYRQDTSVELGYR